MVARDDEVRNLLPLKPMFAKAGATLREAAAALRNRDVGLLLVDDGRGFGVLSERDVVTALADGADPDEVWVADVMSQDVVVARPSATVGEVGSMMIDAGMRHVVLAEGDTVIGVVSLRDIAAALLER